MVITKNEQSVAEKPHLRDGAGTVLVRNLMNLENLNGYSKFFSILTLEPGCSIGWHVHTGESETLYVIRGTAELNDNGVVRELSCGDCAHTPSGQGHSLKNKGGEPLEVLALVIIA